MSKKRVFIIPIFAVLVAVGPVSAEEGKKGELITIRQAIDLAESNNPRLKAAAYQIEAAESGITRARSGYLPKVELSETYQRTTNPMWAFGHKLNQESISPADFAADKLNNPDPIDNWGSSLTMTIPIYTGGKVASYNEQARLSKEASLKDQDRVRQEVSFEVTKSYYGITLAESGLEAVRDALKTAAANMETAKKLRDAGVMTESDFLNARAQLAGLKEEEIMASNSVALSKAVLNNVMGVDLEADYSPSERLPDDLEKAGAEYGLVHGAGKQVDPTTERADLAGMRLRGEIGEKGVKAAQAEYLPTVGLMANYEIDGKTPTSADGNNWTVMGVLKWNLFGGYESAAKVGEARAESNRIKEMRREMESGIRLEALRARLELKISRERVYAARESVRALEEDHRTVNNKYNQGMAAVVDLMNAGTALKRARMGLYQAIYDYKVGEARLKLALGILK